MMTHARPERSVLAFSGELVELLRGLVEAINGASPGRGLDGDGAFADLAENGGRLAAEYPAHATRLASVHGVNGAISEHRGITGLTWHEVALGVASRVVAAWPDLSSVEPYLPFGDELRVRLGREALAAVGQNIPLPTDSPLLRPIGVTARRTWTENELLGALKTRADGTIQPATLRRVLEQVAADRAGDGAARYGERHLAAPVERCESAPARSYAVHRVGRALEALLSDPGSAPAPLPFDGPRLAA